MNAKAIERVCRLPVEYRSGTISWLDLLAQSGLREGSISISQGQLVECLRNKPDLVKAWFAFSEDKRASPGWYLKKGGRGRYVVGWYPGPTADSFTDRLVACAEFIRRELGATLGTAG